MEHMLKEIISKLDGLDRRMETMENRMGALENRMDRMERKVDAIEEQVVKNSENEKLNALAKSMEFIKATVFRHEEDLYFIKQKIS